VSFTTLTISCDTPGNLSATDITETSAIIHWSLVPGAPGYVVQLRVMGGSWSTAMGSPFSDTSATLSNLNPATTYEWRVRANCGHPNQSDWSDISSFTTEGMPSGEDNDECINATLLTVNSTCEVTPASNVGATPSIPAPMGWCPTNQYKDVWFKFAMPDVSNPSVTIRTIAGTLTDAVMEVYSGECSNLTLLSCEDDNYNGNGNAMPVISLTGSANMAIWVRVWGYAGTTGSFGICVLDYQSNNFAVPVQIFDIQDTSIPVEIVKGMETSTDVETISHTLRAVPNPVRDVLYVTMTQTEKTSVTGMVLMDMSGKVVVQQSYLLNDATEFEDQLNVSGVAPGIYVLQILTTEGILTRKVSVVE
jgi:hypothetical protein